RARGGAVDGGRQARDAARAPARQDRGEGRGSGARTGPAAEGRSESPLMNLLVFAEVRDGKLKKSSLETLSAAARLAKPTGSKVGGGVGGGGIKADAETLGKYGAAQVFAVDSPRLKLYASEAYAKAVVTAHQKLGSGAILMAATSMGRDLAGAVAALLGTGSAT